MILPESTITFLEASGNLANGETRPISVRGDDYIYVAKIKDNDGVTTDIQASVNGLDFALFEAGGLLKGAMFRGDFQTLTLKNNSGVAVSYTLLHGKGDYSNPSAVILQNPKVDISSNVRTVGGDAALAGVKVYADLASITVTNTGAGAITVGGMPLPAGDTENISANGNDTFSITVDASGSTARIRTLK